LRGFFIFDFVGKGGLTAEVNQSRGASPPDFNQESTKEDCSSYPPWMLQDAPTELKAPCAHWQICYRFRRMRPCTCES